MKYLMFAVEESSSIKYKKVLFFKDLMLAIVKIPTIRYRIVINFI